MSKGTWPQGHHVRLYQYTPRVPSWNPRPVVTPSWAHRLEQQGDPVPAADGVEVRGRLQNQFTALAAHSRTSSPPLAKDENSRPLATIFSSSRQPFGVGACACRRWPELSEKSGRRRSRLREWTKKHRSTLLLLSPAIAYCYPRYPRCPRRAPGAGPSDAETSRSGFRWSLSMPNICKCQQIDVRTLRWRFHAVVRAATAIDRGSCCRGLVRACRGRPDHAFAVLRRLDSALSRTD